MSHYNVSVAFYSADWPAVRESLENAAGKDSVQSLLDEAEMYEDREGHVFLKWVRYNHFFETSVGEKIAEIVDEKTYPCDFLAVSEDGCLVKGKDLSRSDIGALEIIPQHAIMPNETYPAAQDGIIASLTGVLLLLGLSEQEIADAVTTLDGHKLTAQDKVMSRYIRLAKKKMAMDDDLGEKALKDIALTAKGYRELRCFLENAAALRKELLDGKKDTDNEVQPLSIGTVLTDVTSFLGEDLDDEYCQNFGVTDNEDTRRPICLQVGKHIQVKNPECWMYSDSVQDVTGAISGQLAIPSFSVGEEAVLKTAEGSDRFVIVACILEDLDSSKISQILTRGSIVSKKIGSWFCTDRGNIFVVAERIC